MNVLVPSLRTTTAIVLSRARPVAGYLPGMSQAVLILELELPTAVSRDALDAFDDSLTGTLPGARGWLVHDSVRGNPVLSRIVATGQAVLESAGMPTFIQPRVMGVARNGPPAFRLAVPSYAHQETLDAFTWTIQLLNLALQEQPVQPLLALLPKLIEKIALQAPQGMNTRRLLQTANDLDIPWRHVWGNVFQFGWGSRARRMNSTFTDATPTIGITLVRDKRAAARILRAAGIPVPAHEQARDADHAVALAAKLGYPVVVKPADQDGGRGVSAGLLHEPSVRAAFEAASALSKAVLVEKHVEGNDYRVHVHHNEVYWAAHRIPGGVTGDGEKTVQQLLAQANADPDRGARGSKALLKRIDVDAEAMELLSEQGLAVGSVPAVGRFVRLRRAANVASGGTPVPVLELAHPDNLALCVRATRVMGLDLAGVDLLIPDIGRSWLETGAAICEVNAQPQLGALVPPLLLTRLLPKSGRIPVVIMLGEPGPEFHERLRAALSGLGRVGVAQKDAVRVGAAIVATHPGNAFEAGLALTGDPDVDVAVMVLSDTSMLRTGMPVDAFDVLVLAGPADTGDTAEWKRWLAFSEVLASMCRGTVIVNQDCTGWTAFMERPRANPVVPVTLDGLPEAIRGALITSSSVQERGGGE